MNSVKNSSIARWGVIISFAQEGTNIDIKTQISYLGIHKTSSSFLEIANVVSIKEKQAAGSVGFLITK